MNTTTTTTTTGDRTFTVRIPERVLEFLRGTGDYSDPIQRSADAVDFYACVAATKKRHGTRGITVTLTLPALQYLFEYADYLWSCSEDDASWVASARADRRASKQLMDTLRDLAGNDVYRRRVAIGGELDRD